MLNWRKATTVPSRKSLVAFCATIALSGNSPDAMTMHPPDGILPPVQTVAGLAANILPVAGGVKRFGAASSAPLASFSSTQIAPEWERYCGARAAAGAGIGWVNAGAEPFVVGGAVRWAPTASGPDPAPAHHQIPRASSTTTMMPMIQPPPASADLAR